MSFHDWFDLENSFDNWEGACCRSDLRARDDCLMDIQSRLSSYLRECYVSETVLHAALRRSMDEHDLDIRIEPHLPKTERIRKMAFGEALCLLFFREKDGFWAPLDKLGGGSPNPEATTSGIDILAFYFADEDAGQSDRLYIFEVKTTSDRAYVKRSIVDPKDGMSTFFNEKLVLRDMIQHEINFVLQTIEKQDGQRHLVPRVLKFYNMPLERRKQHEYYCPTFVLDAGLEVDGHLLLLRNIKHPVHQKWLHVMRICQLDTVVAATFNEAAR
jgi:hypothetical protein